MNVKVSNANQPTWKIVTVKSHLPEALKKLDEMAHNLWWSWSADARTLFRSLDEELWKKVDKNPIELLRRIDYDRLKELSKDKELLAAWTRCTQTFMLT